jgi:hypothetical protein
MAASNKSGVRPCAKDDLYVLGIILETRDTVKRGQCLSRLRPNVDTADVAKSCQEMALDQRLIAWPGVKCGGGLPMVFCYLESGSR